MKDEPEGRSRKEKRGRRIVKEGGKLRMNLEEEAGM